MIRFKKITYTLSGKLFSDFTETFGIDFNSSGCINGRVDQECTYLSGDTCEGAIDTLGEFMVLAATDSDYIDLFDGMEEWDSLNKYNAKKLNKLPKTRYEDYIFQTTLDGTDESIVKLIYELLANTDFQTRITIERKVERICPQEIESKFCGHMADGDEILTYPNNGDKVAYYRAYLLDGDEEKVFIEYNFGELSIIDVFDYDDEYIFDDNTISSIFKNIEKESLCGIEKIKVLRSDSFAKIEIPETCLEIFDDVFNCDMVEEIIVRRTNTRFHENAIPVPDGITLVGYKGSTAEIYAKEHGMEFKTLPDEKVPTQREQIGEHLSVLLPVESVFQPLEIVTNDDEKTLPEFPFAARLTLNCPMKYPGETMTFMIASGKVQNDIVPTPKFYIIKYGKIGDEIIECAIGGIEYTPCTKDLAGYQVSISIRFCKDNIFYTMTNNDIIIEVPISESNNVELIVDGIVDYLELVWKLIDGMTYDGEGVTVISEFDRDDLVEEIYSCVDIPDPQEALQLFVKKLVLYHLGAEDMSDLNPLSSMIYDSVYKEVMEKIKSGEL